MTYHRVIPRDLFNEGKLLTCLGHLSLSIHNDVGGISNILSLEHTDEEEAFLVCQDEDGSLFVSNLQLIAIGEPEDNVIFLSTAINTRYEYPLEFKYQDFNGYVFSQDGYSPDFIKLLKRVSA